MNKQFLIVKKRINRIFVGENFDKKNALLIGVVEHEFNCYQVDVLLLSQSKYDKTNRYSRC